MVFPRFHPELPSSLARKPHMSMVTPSTATAPDFKIPSGACDCHMHVFGTQEDFPLAAQRSYTPPPARLTDYLSVSRQIGLERVVFVQPSVYGLDNRCMLDAMRSVGAGARAVAVVDQTMAASELSALNRAGVRGVRLNAASNGQDAKEEIESRLIGLADLAASLGWHIQLFASIEAITAVAPVLRRLPVPCVIDHMGLASAERGLDQPGFSTLLGLLSDRICWIKLSGAYRISSQEPGFQDSIAIARALIAANPERAVWGSDWPHTPEHSRNRMEEPEQIEFRNLDDAGLLKLLTISAGNEVTLRRVLVDNPAKLYGF